MPFHINRKDAESGKEPKRSETGFYYEKRELGSKIDIIEIC